MLGLHQPQLIQGSLLQLRRAEGKWGACELCSLPPSSTMEEPFLLGLLLSPHPQASAAPQTGEDNYP